MIITITNRKIKADALKASWPNFIGSCRISRNDTIINWDETGEPVKSEIEILAAQTAYEASVRLPMNVDGPLSRALIKKGIVTQLEIDAEK